MAAGHARVDHTRARRLTRRRPRSPMRLTILTEDDDGESHYIDADLDLSERAFAPPAPPMYVSEPVVAARGVFFEIPAGWFGDWHPAPCRQYYVQTSGE